MIDVREMRNQIARPSTTAAVRAKLDEIEQRAEAATPGHNFVIIDRPVFDGFVAALRAVLDLHHERPGDGALEQTQCMADDFSWPCPTVRAITESLGGAA